MSFVTGAISARRPLVEEARTLGRVAAGFDADGYRTLCRPLLGESTEVLKL